MQRYLIENLISFKNTGRWFIFCRIVMYILNAVKTALQGYSLLNVAYSNWKVFLSSSDASCIFLSHSEGKIWEILIMGGYTNIASVASENSVCKPPVERHARLSSVVLRFIYV